MSKLSRCTWEETNLLEVDFFLGFKFFTRKVSTTSTVSPPFPWKIQEWSSSGNGNLKTTNQRAEIAFNRLLKVPFVNPPKDAKNSASSAVKFVNQYSGLGHAVLKFCLDWVSLAWTHTQRVLEIEKLRARKEMRRHHFFRALNIPRTFPKCS